MDFGLITKYLIAIGVIEPIPDVEYIGDMFLKVLYDLALEWAQTDESYLTQQQEKLQEQLDSTQTELTRISAKLQAVKIKQPPIGDITP